MTMPTTLTIDRAREIARELGCTHEAQSQVITRYDYSSGYEGGETVILGNYFGKYVDGQFVELFSLGAQITGPVRNVHDYRHLSKGGREWCPEILANCADVWEL